MVSNLEYKICDRETASGYAGLTDMGANISNHKEYHELGKHGTEVTQGLGIVG